MVIHQIGSEKLLHIWRVMLIDYEAVVADFRAYIETRPSHGQRDLRAKLSDLLVEHRIKEGVLEKALRVFGIDLSAQIRKLGILPPSDGVPVGDDTMTGDPGHRMAQATEVSSDAGIRRTHPQAA